MNNNILKGDLNLTEKTGIALMISHEENRNILKKILEADYEVITCNFDKSLKNTDLIIADEQGMVENKEVIFRSKNSSSYLYVPFLLITRLAKGEIPHHHLEIVDEIMEIPMEPRLLISRIKNQLNIRALILSTQVFQKIIDNNPVGVCILLEGKRIKYVNNAFLEITEKKRKNLMDKNILEVLPGQWGRESFSKERKRNKSTESIKLSFAEQIKWIDIQSREINFRNIKLHILMLTDYTENKKQQEEIKYLSYKDKLTDLYNRRFFEEEIERLDTERQLPLSIIMADVNGLKIINDTFGHKAGDELLIKTADLLKEAAREEDIVARQGGDEFAILLPKTKKADAEEIVKRIKEKVEKTSREALSISVALGVATKEDPGEDIEEVLRKADDDMYENKESEGRKSKSNIIQSLLTTLSGKSYETKEHALRMTKLAFDFGKSLNISTAELNRLSLLATLHDVGKTTIPREILNKPGKLTKEEWSIMEKHSEKGYKIASASEEFSPVAKDVLTHHERWDGKGYPEGLRGGDIPYLARIITIIDAYDVMTNDQPYSRGRTKQEALKEIKKCAGTQFDPELAKQFTHFMEASPKDKSTKH